MRAVYFNCVAPFGIAWVLIVMFNAATRRCFDRSIDTSLIFKFVLFLISAMATSSALWRKFAQIGNWRLLNDVSIRTLDRLQPENFSELLKRNALGPVSSLRSLQRSPGDILQTKALPELFKVPS
jgi:hypothetical protein